MNFQVSGNDVFAVVLIVNACAVLAGKFSIYRKHFKSTLMLLVVMILEQASFLGLCSLKEMRAIDTVFAALIASYVSAALWDSRSFNIESLSWRHKLYSQAFYVIVSLSTIVMLSGSVEFELRVPVWIICAGLALGVLMAEITYSVCKRKKLLMPAWQGTRSESRYGSQMSSTITTPTSDRIIRI